MILRMSVAQVERIVNGPVRPLGRRLRERSAGAVAALGAMLVLLGAKVRPYATVGSVGALCVPAAAYLWRGAALGLLGLGLTLIVLEVAAEK
jgi:hypothetical protein